MHRLFLLPAFAFNLLCTGLFAAAQPPSVTPPVPQEVRNYLAFVQHIEATKIAMMRQQVAEDLQRQQNAPGEQAKARKDVNYKRERQKEHLDYVQRQASEWRQVLTVFQQKPAPPSCKDLFAKYLIHLNTVEQTMRKVEQTLEKTTYNSKRALDSLSGMMGTSAEGQAAITARSADQCLKALCSRWGLYKTFTVRANSGITLQSGPASYKGIR